VTTVNRLIARVFPEQADLSEPFALQQRIDERGFPTFERSTTAISGEALSEIVWTDAT
jgi:hypothetical protein